MNTYTVKELLWEHNPDAAIHSAQGFAGYYMIKPTADGKLTIQFIDMVDTFNYNVENIAPDLTVELCRSLCDTHHEARIRERFLELCIKG